MNKKNKKLYIIILILGILIISGLFFVLITNKNSSGNDSNQNKYTDEEQQYFNQIIQNIELSKKHIIDEVEKGKIIELSDNGSLYYLAKDGKRYIFPNKDSYNSWFVGISPSTSYTLEEIQKYPLGGNVGIKPGNLIQTPTDYNLYLVLKGEKLSIIDKNLIEKIYGKKYKNFIITVPNYYFTNYKRTTKVIKEITDFPIIDPLITIDENKGF